MFRDPKGKGKTFAPEVGADGVVTSTKDAQVEQRRDSAGCVPRVAGLWANVSVCCVVSAVLEFG
ncbi:hypothetical protein CCHOA_06945 [Corynebacterium choanae]|uniref:Uncharacterized protein n=1 Tax=Corynebacterium choanae TaxID=1862358 RepID=A0A3G6J6Q2_9CORY|nr:hypothetical protein CCHOA_06945 [Corynebacterium choanae]